VNPLQPAIDLDAGALHIGIENSVGLGSTKLPLSAVVIADIAAEHLALAAEVTLSHRVELQTVKKGSG
jgi:hypothetical protein